MIFLPLEVAHICSYYYPLKARGEWPGWWEGLKEVVGTWSHTWKLDGPLAHLDQVMVLVGACVASPQMAGPEET